MVDNFDYIARLIDGFNKEVSAKHDLKDVYYHLQVIKRSKDTHEGANSVLIKAYQIDLDHPLERYKDDIIELCERFKARAYINPSPKSKEATAVQMLTELSDCFRKHDFNYLKRLWNSAAGKVGAIDKHWVIDCDYSENFGDRDIATMAKFIDRECEPFDKVKYISCIPTRSGKHLITHPFNVARFAEVYPDIAVHKNNPTVLYVPESLGK